jgi:hypothetical protein
MLRDGSLRRAAAGARAAQRDAALRQRSGDFFRCQYEPWRETEADIAIVGVPFDGGVTNRPGARHGPRRVREASADHVRPLTRGRSPLELAACVDGGDVAVQRPYELEGAHGEIEAAFRAATFRGVATLAVGGDHSVTLPILRGLVHARGGEPLGLVHLDAHCDTGDDYLGSRFHHGAPFKIAVDEGLLDPKRCVQLGIRGTLAAPDAWAFSTASSPVWKSTTGLGRPDQTLKFSSSVKSKSTRLIFGRIDCSHRVLEAQRKCSCQNIRILAH